MRSFAAALALADTLSALGVPEADVALKWPNDVQIQGKMVAGILAVASLLKGEGTVAIPLAAIATAAAYRRAGYDLDDIEAEVARRSERPIHRPITAIFTRSDRVVDWRAEYGKPIVNDELEYDDNITYPWGGISAEEETHRVWIMVANGGYAGARSTSVMRSAS